MRSSSGQLSAPLPLPDERPRLAHLGGVRWGLLAAALALTVLGLATVHSASAETGADFMQRQFVWVGDRARRDGGRVQLQLPPLLSFSLPLYLASLVALALVLVARV